MTTENGLTIQQRLARCPRRCSSSTTSVDDPRDSVRERRERRGVRGPEWRSRTARPAEPAAAAGPLRLPLGTSSGREVWRRRCRSTGWRAIARSARGSTRGRTGPSSPSARREHRLPRGRVYRSDWSPLTVASRTGASTSRPARTRRAAAVLHVASGRRMPHTMLAGARRSSCCARRSLRTGRLYTADEMAGGDTTPHRQTRRPQSTPRRTSGDGRSR